MEEGERSKNLTESAVHKLWEKYKPYFYELNDFQVVLDRAQWLEQQLNLKRLVSAARKVVLQKIKNKPISV
jgi:hypothetical protein